MSANTGQGRSVETVEAAVAGGATREAYCRRYNQGQQEDPSVESREELETPTKKPRVARQGGSAVADERRVEEWMHAP